MSAIVINILGNAANFISATNQAQSSMDKWAGRAAKAGLAIGGALAGAATAAVKSAADQSAAISAWTQVTGQQMDKQQKTIARSLNLSQTDYAKSYTTLSSLYQSNGIAQDKANEMAAKGLKIAADQAAFGNTTVGEAVEAQAGLLKGSGELLEKYATSITAADVAARMKADGTDKLTGAEFKAASAMAKSNLIMEQSAKFAGQAARESNSLESRQQKLGATVEDFKAKLGTGLLPIVEAFIGKLQSAAEWVEANETKTKIFVGILGGLAAVLLTVAAAIKIVRVVQAAWNAVWVATSAVIWANPIFIIAGILLAIGVALVVAYKKSETFKRIVDAAFKAVSAAASWLWDKIKLYIGLVIAYWKAWFTAAKWVADKVIGAATRIINFVRDMPGKIRSAASGMFNAIGDAFDAVIGRIKGAYYAIPAPIRKAFEMAGGAIGGIAGAVGKGAGLVGKGVGMIPGFASGGNHAGGLRIVGERGPEMEFTGPSRIVPNHALGGGGGITVNVYGTVLDGRQLTELVHTGLLEKQRRTGGLHLR